MKRILVFLALTAVFLPHVAAQANHANNRGAHWRKTTVKVVDSVTATWDDELANGVTSWNDGVKKVDLVVAPGTESSSCPYIKGRIHVCSGDYGGSLGAGVAGLAQYRFRSSSRHITRAKVRVDDVVASGVEQAVMTHELGHTLGLGHRPQADASTSCMTPTVGPTQTEPDDHDYQQVNKLHRHLPHGRRVRAADGPAPSSRYSHDEDVTYRRIGNEIEVTWRLIVR